ncbi:class D beta-lactamase [Oxalobacteraceae bacterium]|nr:class D beta-lactamase [Oxalobacteraceae bacterium]
MSAFDLLLFRFLLASCGCLAAGLGVWALTELCRRCLPDFSLQRSTWLLSQITVLATFLVILLPHSERLRVIPQIELDSETEIRSTAPASPALLAPASPSLPTPAPEANERSWLAYGAQAWLLVYLLGLSFSAFGLWRGRRALDYLAATGDRVQALHQHAGFSTTSNPALSARQAAAPLVIEVDAPISPMLFGLFQPRLLLPRHLRNFDPLQQQLIVEHELTHLRRHDLHWMSAGVLLQTLLWFNPFMRLLRENLLWAQELGCDRDVLRNRTQAQRKAYAAALVAQLRVQHQPVQNALAFGAISATTLAARIALIRAPSTGARKLWARCAAAAAMAGMFAGSLAFQPAIASRSEHLAQATQSALDSALQSVNSSVTQTPFSCTELADAASGRRLVHEGHCDERVTPASTFNIAVSLMGYDSGILHDAHAPVMPFRSGYADWNRSWRASTDPSSWIKNSVLWYAQQVTAKLGAERFEQYVKSFNYGNHDVSGDSGSDNGLATSWVGSSLKISPVEQVDFLRKLVNRQLPLSPKAYDMTFRIMPPIRLSNGWEVHGKTGTAALVLPDGKDDPVQQYGWFVGWASKGERTVVFARLALDQRQKDHPGGGRAKEALLRDLPARLNAL